MMRRMFLLAILLVSTLKCTGETRPREGSIINYTLAGFAIAKIEKATDYTFEVATGHYDNETDFERNVTFSKISVGPKTAIQLPAFGQRYTWRVTTRSGGKEIVTALYHFATDTSKYVDTTQYRLRVLSNNYEDSSLLFFLDYSRCLYNLKGEAVWFLPNIAPFSDSSLLIRDMRVTSFGTITFLSDTGAYEIDYDGNILWTAPRPADERQRRRFKQYHHELKRRSNGNYMIMSSELVSKKLAASDLAKVRNVELGNGVSEVDEIIEYSKVSEFTPTNKLVWEWHSGNYFNGSDIVFVDGRGGYSTGTHMNNFFLDEKNQAIYVGFRDRNRIVKLKYPSNELIAEYGDGPRSMGKGYFKGQHSAAINSDGHLYLFNNNVGGVNRDATSSIIVMREPQRPEDSLVKLWEFSCDMDKEAGWAATRGGSVNELADGSIFCCMGLTPRVFIVDRDKKVKFNAIVEKRVGQEWREFPQYHAYMANKHIVTKLLYK